LPRGIVTTSFVRVLPLYATVLRVGVTGLTQIGN